MLTLVALDLIEPFKPVNKKYVNKILASFCKPFSLIRLQFSVNIFSKNKNLALFCKPFNPIHLQVATIHKQIFPQHFKLARNAIFPPEITSSL